MRDMLLILFCALPRVCSSSLSFYFFPIIFILFVFLVSVRWLIYLYIHSRARTRSNDILHKFNLTREPIRTRIFCRVHSSRLDILDV